MGRLDGRVAIVTGAARGTGEQVARLFAAEGANVAMGDVASTERVVGEIGPSARAFGLDVTDERSWADLVDAVLAEWGRVDVLVNNAAILKMAAIEDTSREDFLRIVEVNQLGPFLGIRAVLEPMKAAGGGSIVNVSSINGLQGLNGVAAYGSSKFGLRGLAKNAAAELGKYGIRVNTICPDVGSFEMVEPWLTGGLDVEGLMSRKPLRRFGELTEVARAALFLASDDSSYCTGIDLSVDGGSSSGSVLHGQAGS